MSWVPDRKKGENNQYWCSHRNFGWYCPLFQEEINVWGKVVNLWWTNMANTKYLESESGHGLVDEWKNTYFLSGEIKWLS